MKRTDEEVADLFCRYAAKWHEETKFESSLQRLFLNPWYQKIIGLGPQAIPLLLGDLEESPGAHWFWALSSLVGADEAAGTQTVQDAADRWVAWGREAGEI